MTDITTRWSDLRGEEIRHQSIIGSHTTLCGLGLEHTRNFVKHAATGTDVRCDVCALEVARINMENAWTWPERSGAGPRVDSANFPSDEFAVNWED